jgi:hypothetical protein
LRTCSTASSVPESLPSSPARKWAKALCSTNSPRASHSVRTATSSKPRSSGITESLGETSDLLLLAVSSLYTRWIASSSFREQGGVVAAQQNDDLIGRAGEVVGKLFKSPAIKPLEPVADLVIYTLSGLASANRDLKSGRLELPRLQTEQARDLLQIVARISGRPLVLIMDQWEKSPSPDIECNIPENFLQTSGTPDGNPDVLAPCLGNLRHLPRLIATVPSSSTCSDRSVRS